MPSHGRSVAAILQIRAAMAAVFLGCLVLVVGCKTSEDAAAAATQMSATAKSLSDYYAALSTILSDTDQIYALNEALYSKPYSPKSRQEVKTTQAELTKY
jgi:outer membrane lipoprotein-sorting protein